MRSTSGSERIVQIETDDPEDSENEPDLAQPDPEEDKTEQAKAYKKLMDDLGRGAFLLTTPTSEMYTSCLIAWIVHAILFIVFVVLVITFAKVHVIHVHQFLHMDIYSWVAFLMVIVSGYPWIQLITLMVSEPFVWAWRNHKYVAFFAFHLKRSVDVTLWFMLVLWVWYTWFRPQIVKDTSGAHTLRIPVEQYQAALKVGVKQVTRLLLALAIGACLWTVKNVVFLRLVADLHFKELCDRLRHTILDFHALQLLDNSTARLNDAAEGNMSFWMCVSRITKETIPIWILQPLMKSYMADMRKRKPRDILARLDSGDDYEKLIQQLNDLHASIIKCHQQDHDDITGEDLAKYGLNDNEIEFVLKLFPSKEDGTADDRIPRDRFLRWGVLAVKNCLGGQRVIESSASIFWKLDVLMSTCVVVVTLVIWLLLSELVTTGQIAILFAPFLSASFIIGDSLKRAFDGIIFIFGMHPFDVGDHVRIDDIQMKVNKMNIMTTIFTKYDSGVEAIYPNCELSTKVINNLYINLDQPDSIEFTLPIETPLELICDLQIKIKKILDDDITYTSNTVVAKKSVSKEGVMLVVYFKYLVPYLSTENKAKHRSKIFCKIMRMQMQMEMEKKDMEPSPVEVGILRFEIDAKTTLFEIEQIKDKIMRILHNYNPSLKKCSKVLFIGIDNGKITMDVRMRSQKGVFEVDNKKDKLQNEMELAIGDEQARQRKNNVKSFWVSEPDWDDNC